jgi:hypothetical protein
MLLDAMARKLAPKKFLFFYFEGPGLDAAGRNGA